MFKSLKWNVVNQDNEIISSHETKQEAIKSMNEIESSAMLEQKSIEIKKAQKKKVKDGKN